MKDPGRGSLGDPPLDRAPGSPEEARVRFERRRFGASPRGADDEPAGRRRKSPEDVAQTHPFVGIVNPSGDSAKRHLGGVDQITPRQGDEACDARPLAADRFADHLDDQLPAFLQPVLDRRSGRRDPLPLPEERGVGLAFASIAAVFCRRTQGVNGRRLAGEKQLRDVKKGAPLLAGIEKGGLDPGEHLDDARLHDVADREPGLSVFDPQLHRDAVLA